MALTPVQLSAIFDEAWIPAGSGDESIDTPHDRSDQAGPSRLKKLLKNLTGNAIEHGGEVVNITIDELPDLFVEDGGARIAPEERDRIADSGYLPKRDGTGFGPNVVRQVAVAHHWRIDVFESTEGGARFEIVNGEKNEEHVRSAEARLGRSGEALNGARAPVIIRSPFSLMDMVDRIRILHVEDEPEFADLTATYLEREDERFDVIDSQEPELALDIIADTTFDCIVADYDLPKMNGIEFLKTIRTDDRGIPIILFTGKGSEEVAADAITAGATDYIQKEPGSSQFTILANRIKNVVEQHRSQREVEASERRLSLFVEQSPLGVIEWNDDFEFVRVNDTAEEILGYTEAELVGAGWDRIVPEQHRDEIADVVVGDLLANEGGFHSINENLTKDSEVIVCEWHNHVVTDGDEVIAVFSQFQDVTDRQQREHMFEELVEHTPDLIQSSTRAEVAEAAVNIARSVLDSPLAGVHLVADNGNRLEAIAIMDEVRDEIGVAPTYDRADDDRITQIVWETFDYDEARYIEDTEAIGDLGRKTPARSVIVQPLTAHGVLIISKAEPAAFDNTERMYAELLAQTLTAALDGVARQSILQDHKHRLERLHEAAEAIHQMTSREEIAEQVVEAAEDILDFPLAAVRYNREEAGGLVPIAVSDSTQEVLGSLEVFGPEDGSLNWDAYESGSSAMYGNLSEIGDALDTDSPIESLMHFPMGEHGTISVSDTHPHSFDETDRFHGELLARTAEQALSQLDRETELMRQRDELDRQNERLEEFASVVSHDLRNPLTVAQGNLELAMETGDTERLATVGRALDRMQSLIEDLLALARYGESVVDIGPVQLSTVAKRCWENVQTGGATLRVEFDRTIVADQPQIAQLLENLFRNAVDHGGEDIEVTVGPLDDGFYIEDDGPGIPEADRERVFETGYSSSPTGTGFGLSIVNDAAASHGWDVTLKSGTEGGTRFEVTGITFV